jgi:hypothetical protein
MLQAATLRARRHEKTTTVPIEISLMNRETREDAEELETFFHDEHEELDSPFAVRENPTREELEAIAWFYV